MPKSGAQNITKHDNNYRNYNPLGISFCPNKKQNIYFFFGYPTFGSAQQELDV